MSNDRFIKRLDIGGEKGRKITNLITQIAELKAKFKVQSHLSPQLIDRLTQSVLITSSGASTRIEGSLLGDMQVKELFNKLGIQKFKSRDEQEVVGYLELLKLVFENWKSIKFNESTIKNFHSILLKYSVKDERHKGNWKFGSNRVEARSSDGELIGIVFDPTPPYLVEIEIRGLVEFTQTELEKGDFNPLLIIGNFVYEYLSIHPFQDGNGRSSRVLTNLLLLQQGFDFTPFISHERIIERNKEEYYKVLNSSQKTWKTDDEDISSWLLFFLEVVKIQAQEAVNLLENKENMDVILSEKQLLVWNVINEAQKELSTGRIAEITKLPIPTVKQALNKLINLNKIDRLGEGRAVRYRLVTK
jgi:Fic family protein